MKILKEPTIKTHIEQKQKQNKKQQICHRKTTTQKEYIF